MAKKDILAELKSAIGQKITPHAAPAPAATGSREAAQPPAPKAAPRERPRSSRTAKPVMAELAARSGRGVQFYLDDTDRRIIHRLAVWFGSQDRRVSDSQVIKAAIRMADTQQGAKLLDLCDQVRATDRRRQKKTPPGR